ncbi:MAG: hypothetical protein WAN46_09725 [Gammaproteobacteria bacterium]|jgi:hypothetical protein
MKYLKPDSAIPSQEMASDFQESKALLESRLMALRERSVAPESQAPLPQALLQLEIARVLVDLERGNEAWGPARKAFDRLVALEQWEQATEASEILFLADQPDSLVALGHAIWLAVTYPVNPELTVAMLQHVVHETPKDADGAAVAAATAHYIVELRAEDKERENLGFFTSRMLATVARQHSNVKEQPEFDAWVKRLELDDPAKFLVRLRNVVDVLVQDQWWFDRTALQEKLPVN